MYVYDIYMYMIYMYDGNLNTNFQGKKMPKEKHHSTM